MYTSRLVVLRHWEEALAEGVELLGTDRPAGRRLDESREFIAFIQGEVAGIVQRWQERPPARAGGRG
jgi:hypothetical protein